MKKLILLALILMFLLPPALPSSFYGEITGAASGVVTVQVNGQQVASVPIQQWEGKPVYALNVEAVGVAVFYVNGRYAGRAALLFGSNRRLDLAVRRTV